ncbi:MAG: DMT family transporter [Kangiellaceae bacterium]|jgi:drug/metabolite transporter (DMT)-like permease|nr:DMT family transporter [Kangiellaceae bacterium]
MLAIVTTLFALIAFAANSVLCRLALAGGSIDPLSFTVIRLLSGAIMLTILVLLTPSEPSLTRSELVNTVATRRSWLRRLAPVWLFLYAILFSLAYVELSTATGALILFAFVQFTMIGSSLIAGNKLSWIEWFGLIISIIGFTWLMLPGLSAPPIFAACLMVCSGISWGLYTMAGKVDNSQNKTGVSVKLSSPLRQTAINFLLSIPLALLLVPMLLSDNQFTMSGIGFAILSGTVASGLGYAIWYIALKHINVTLAAVAQLSVPLIAAVFGFLLVGETLSEQQVLAVVLILVGIAIVSLRQKILDLFSFSSLR